MKLNEGGKVFPVGGNVARKAHRNDNPHLDRLHPPQMEELVAQKQVRFFTHKFQFGCGILKMVGLKKQIFWPRINKGFFLSVVELQFVKKYQNRTFKVNFRCQKSAEFFKKKIV